MPGKSKSVHNLPAEMLVEIFIMCPATPSIVLPIPSARSAPLNLSRVCKRWRNIALSVSQLWSDFEITIHSGNRPGDGLLFNKMLRNWLQRSKHSPLTFQVHVGYDIGIKEKHSADVREGRIPLSLQVFNEVAVHQNRWKIINIESHVPFDSGSNLILNNMPMLEEMDLFLDFDTLPLTTNIDISESPLLRRLGIHVDGKHSLRFGHRNYNHLTHVNLKCLPSMDAVLGFLKACPVLEEFGIYEIEESVPRVPIQITMSRLRKLKLVLLTESTDRKMVKAAFDSLTLPALVDLGLEFDIGLIPDHDSVGIADLIKRSQARLWSLSLTGSALSSREMLSCLQQCPHLVHLEFSSIDCIEEDDARELIANLTFSDGNSTPVCPQLQTIQLLDWWADGLLNDVARMIASRWREKPTSRHLEEVRVDFAVLWGSEEMALIEECVDEGLLFSDIFDDDEDEDDEIW